MIWIDILFKIYAIVNHEYLEDGKLLVDNSILVIDIDKKFTS